MKFTEAEAPLTEDDVSAAEMHAGVLLPRGLRRQYLQSNGGTPDSYVYEDDNLDTVVAEFLPLKSSRGTGTAVDAYRNLVLSKRIVPLNFFPFAVDGGGDYFFLDCSSPDGLVYFYRGDTSDDERQRLLALNVGIGEFWSRLKKGVILAKAASLSIYGYVHCSSENYGKISTVTRFLPLS